MINEIQGLLDEYARWLKEKTLIRQVDEWVKITTPYLDRHNDYVLTDAGYILQDLELSGCRLDTAKEKVSGDDGTQRVRCETERR